MNEDYNDYKGNEKNGVGSRKDIATNTIATLTLSQ